MGRVGGEGRFLLVHPLEFRFRLMSYQGMSFFGRKSRFYKKQVPRRSVGIRKPYSRISQYKAPVRKYGYTRNVRSTNGNARPEELKYFDIASAVYPCSTSAGVGVEVTLINSVIGGSTVVTRVGNQMIMKSIAISGVIKPVDATVIRSRNDLFIIYDKTPSGALPNKTDIFTEAISGAPMNLDYRERFVVVHHSMYNVGGLFAAGEALTPTITNVNVTKALNLRTTFKSVNAAIGDITAGALYMVWIGDQAAADGAVFRGTVRLRFAER